MAAELIGGAFISGAIQLLLERIASSEVANFLLGKKNSDFDGLLGRLRTTVSSLNGVLVDAEQRQMRDDPRVEAWLDDVQEAIFNAEDLLDEIEYEALRLKAVGDSGAGTSEVREVKRPKILNMFPFSRNWIEKDAQNGIRKILDRLEEIAKQKELLGLKETLGEEKRWQRPPSTSLVEEYEVYGRDDDEEAVIKWLLLSDDSSAGGERISVIPIVGMGGVGKTTLAQTLFNHSRVKENFDLMLWVCVSENYDIRRTTSTLLFSGSSSLCHEGDLNSLQVRLREKLAGKKFLIVLDDVWNEKYEDWEVMRMPFKDGAQGSKIVVTTRSQEVARITGTVSTHHLDVLNEEASWQLFVKHIFRDNLDPELEKIGKEIVKKCKGLPLAVKTLGGLLRSKLEINYWERISASEIWELEDKHSNILPVLRLSYHYLPSHLKRCFSYCAIFPKDYTFEMENLVSLWMAENLLEQPKGNMTVEEVGDQYFNDLLSISFFQPSGSNNSFFVMHDLIVDLATFVSRKYCSRLEGRISDDEVIKETTRHLSCVLIDDIICDKVNTSLETNRLRTFLQQSALLKGRRSVSKRALRDFFLKFKRLRVLSFSNYEEECGLEMESICELKHLCFLKLSNLLSIKCLPDSLCTLYNLRTLKLVNCMYLRKLPEDFHHLFNLRYLDLYGAGLDELPESLSLLQNLQKLILRGCWKLKKLPQDFHIINLRYLDASCTELDELPESLCLMRNLQKLIVRGSRKLHKLPKGFHRLINLKYLDVSSTRLAGLPESLGLLTNLRFLDVSSSQLQVLPESLSLLSSLQHLDLSCCSKLNKLPESFHLLVNLRHLNVEGSGLKKMPTRLSKLKSLRTLSTFVIGKDNGASIKEITNLVDLRGKLCIKNLHNVINPEDALAVELREMKHLDALEFRWTSPRANNTRQDSRILNNLVPPKGLKKLDIIGYGDTKFSDWLNQQSFCNLVDVHLSGCHKCTTLPQLGRLPSLKKLQIGRFNEIVKVGPEFYGARSSILKKPFSSLEELSFYEMRSWKEWSMPDDDDVAFPKLMKLTLNKCNTLEEDLHRFLPSLTELIISTCEELSSSSLQMLETTIQYYYGTELCCPPSTLKILHIDRYNSTKLFSTAKFLPSLTSLTLGSCRELKFLPKNMHKLLPLLEYLHISDCTELESFPAFELPLSLRSFCITNCDKLVASRKNWKLQRALQNLTIFSVWGYKRDDLETFPEKGLLPTTVNRLDIYDIKSLKSLNNEELQQLTSLKVLGIYHCPNLHTMTRHGFPASLEYLIISDCPPLREKCERETGEYWNHIAHIPYISLGN